MPGHQCTRRPTVGSSLISLGGLIVSTNRAERDAQEVHRDGRDITSDVPREAVEQALNNTGNNILRARPQI